MTIRFMKARAIPLLVAIAIASAGCGGVSPQKSPDGEAPISPFVDVKPPVSSMSAAVFFPDWQVQHVIPELRQVPEASGAELATRLVEELLAGPTDPHLLRAFPEGTRLLEPVSLEDGMATVNLSREANQLQGSASIFSALHALRLTLREVPGIEQVRIQVNGRSEGDLGGMVGATQDPMLYLYPVLPNPERAKYLQSRADQGLDAWRKDPAVVAKFEGMMFGFTKDELQQAAVEQDGNEAHAYVTREGTTYAFKLVRNAAAGEDGVWTIDSVSPIQWHEYDSLPLSVRAWADFYTATTIGASKTGASESDGERLYLLASVEEGEVRITSAAVQGGELVVWLAEEGGERFSIASVPVEEAGRPVVFRWESAPAGPAARHTAPDALPILANPHNLPEAKLTGDVAVISPVQEQRVTGPITVRGYARHLFEATISARLLDEKGNEVAAASTLAGASGFDWGSFEIVLAPKVSPGTYRLEVGTYSARDGAWEPREAVYVHVEG